MYFIFPPHLTTASALHGETGKPEIPFFHLNAACFLPKKNTKHSLKYHLVRAEQHFSVQTINWMHQTGPKKGVEHPAACYPHALC